MTNANERAAAGAKLLDTVIPDWFTRINPNGLDMEDCHDCILGQIFGQYIDGIYHLQATTGLTLASEQESPYSGPTAAEHGFSLPDYYATGWIALANAWRHQIAIRKAQP